LGAHVHGRRIADTVVVEPGPAFVDRAAITDRTIPDRAIEADVGVGQARDWRHVFGDIRPDRARSIVEHAVDVGFFERERRNDRLHVRQTARYPDGWFDRLVGIENKPDLDRPGDLYSQLRRDLALSLFDEVVLATASYVTGAHLNRIPEEVGVWRFDPDTGEREVVREPTPLDTDGGSVEIVDEFAGRIDIEPVSAEEKRRARRRLAERAYGKGWRPETLPECVNCDPAADSRDAAVPYCAHYDRIVEPAVECGPDCPGYEPADPPMFDPDEERAANSAWVRDPAGHQRRQAGLDRFG
ncbi:MAG: DUF5787 family protein, partial [Halapricum sp.]